MKINVGDYVRFNCYISKIEHIKESQKGETYIQFKEPNKMLAHINVKLLKIEPSPDVIDLVEVGDYVNGELVSRIKKCPEWHGGNGIIIFNEHNETIYSNFRTSKYEDIKTIITREQIEQVSYKVGEE